MVVLGASVAALLVKEDAALIIASFTIGAALAERSQGRLAALTTGLSLAWLAFYVGTLQPALASAGPTYLGFWADFGDTPLRIVAGIITKPIKFVTLLLTSGWWTFALPGLFLPFLSWRALAGMAPTLVMLGASSNPSMHDYMTYYPVTLVPFALLGILEARYRGGKWATAAFVAVCALPLFWYGYARAVRPLIGLEQAVRAAVGGAAKSPRVVVQPILFPHVGYGSNLRPLMSGEDASGRRGDVFLLAPALDSWPFDNEVPARFVMHLEACGTRKSDPSGLEIVELTRDCPPP